MNEWEEIPMHRRVDRQICGGIYIFQDEFIDYNVEWWVDKWVDKPIDGLMVGWIARMMNVCKNRWTIIKDWIIGQIDR